MAELLIFLILILIFYGEKKMKKSHMAMLIAAGLVTSSLAFAKADKDPLAEITPLGCSTLQIGPFGTSLLGSWSWAEGTVQTKFGGDAEYMVHVSPDDEQTWYDFEVEFEVVKYELDTPADAYPGQFVYRCSNAQTEPSGSCNGSVLGLRAAIMQAAIDELAEMEIYVTAEDIDGNISANLVGVGIKAMDPGTGAKSQKYPKVDICDVPVI
jgi:hypothetical protein